MREIGRRDSLRDMYSRSMVAVTVASTVVVVVEVLVGVTVLVILLTSRLVEVEA